MMTQQEPIGPAVLAMVQAEFVAIRSEIGRLIDHQKDLQNLSLVTLGAVFAFVAAIAQLDPDQNDITLVLLLVPFLTLQFSLTASDLSRRILDLAAYVEELSTVANGMVKELEPNLGEFKVWRWEQWKRDLFQDRGNGRRYTRKGGAALRPSWLIVVVDKAKWLSLLLPGVMSTVAYFVIDDAPIEGYSRKALVLAVISGLAASAALLTMYKSEATGVTPAGRGHVE